MPPKKRSTPAEIDGRLDRIEEAVQKMNHASEQFVEWKGEVSADLRWLKILVGTGAAAGVFTALSEIIRAVAGVK